MSQDQDKKVSQGQTAQVDTLLTVGGRVIVVRAGQLLPGSAAPEAAEPQETQTPAEEPSAEPAAEPTAEPTADPTPSKSKAKGAKPC